MEDFKSPSVESQAITYATQFFRKNGWNVMDVSHFRGDHGGYDLLLQESSRRLTVEVKGSGKLYDGIPDLYGTSVDEDKRLVADFLCVVYFPPKESEKLVMIPRDDLKADCLTRKITYRICNQFKKAENLLQYMIDADKAWTV